MKKAIILSPDMGTVVVDHLRQFGNLPTSGILAGQAVDSALTDLFGKGGGVYNDLDIFRTGAPRPLNSPHRLTANKTASRGIVQVQQRDSGYGHMGVLMSVINTYGIDSVSRDDMLNIVNCTMNWPMKGLTAEQVISGFDINCTRVAVDLETNRLVWDKHYEEFLRSRQLRIAMMHTPWHTFLRLLKKAQELPEVYLDRDVSAEACVAVANSEWLLDMLHKGNVSMSFGEKNVELAQKLKSEWKPYFDLTSKLLYLGKDNKWTENADASNLTEKSTKLWGMTPRSEIDSGLQAHCNRMGGGLLFFGAKLVEAHRRQIAPAAYDKLNAIVAQQRVAMGGPDAAEFVGPHQGLTLVNPEPDNFGAHFIRANAEVLGTDYVQGQALPTMAAKLALWLSQHRVMARGMVGLTLDEQYRRMQSISEICRKFGKKYFDGDTQLGIGVLEGLAESTVFNTDADVERALKDYYDKNHLAFDIKPLPLPKSVPARYAGFRVTELLTPLALRNEGTLMGHCVGGYSEPVRSNVSRIVAVRYLDERKTLNCSTIELKGNFKDHPSRWELSVQQNYSASNKHPTRENKEFVEYVLGYLANTEVLSACEGLSVQKKVRYLKQEARTRASRIKHVSQKLAIVRAEKKELLAGLYDETKPASKVQREKLRDKNFILGRHESGMEAELKHLRQAVKFLRERAHVEGQSAAARQLPVDALVVQSRTKALAAPVVAPVIRAVPDEDFYQAAA